MATRIIAFATLILIMAMGIRQSFGIFLPPVSEALEIGRGTFGMALALQHLAFGFAQPLVGWLADRWGAWKVLLGGGALYGLGLYLVTKGGGALGLQLSLGLMVGLALSATTYVVVLGAISQVVSPQRRSTAFGVATAAGSFGMFAVVPLVQALLTSVGWIGAFELLALGACLISLLALGMILNPAHATVLPHDDPALGCALRAARGHRGYYQLNLGFFVCGFHVAFVATHLPTYLQDEGLSAAQATLAFSLIGLFNIFGSFGFGFMGDRRDKRRLLSLLYFLRTLVFALMLILPLTPTTALIFGGAIGFLWLATVPLTSGLVAQIFGARALSTLYGIVFFSHQIGSFLGAWIGGEVYDRTGSYDLVWWLCVALSLAATLIHFGIDDRRIEVPVASNHPDSKVKR